MLKAVVFLKTVLADLGRLKVAMTFFCQKSPGKTFFSRKYSHLQGVSLEFSTYHFFEQLLITE